VVVWGGLVNDALAAHAPYTPVTLSMLALAWPRGNQSHCCRREISVGADELIAYTLPEIRWLLIKLVLLPLGERVLAHTAR
jgi:hypothetical protein